MDFFEYANLSRGYITGDTWWLPYLVGGICFAVVYIFQSVALFTIAGHEGYKNRWMAWIPFFSTYYIGLLGQKNRAFKKVDTKTIGLAAAILEVVLFAGNLIFYISFENLRASGCVYWDEYGYVDQILNVPPYLEWAEWCFNYLDVYILTWVQLIFLFMQVLIISAFFQTYAPRRYFIFTVTSILFPIQGILFFVVRNSRGINYRDYIRGEQERQYRIYSQYRQQNFNQNPYNQNPYDNYPSGGQYGQTSNNFPADDPFSDLSDGASNIGDPFDGFDDTKH